MEKLASLRHPLAQQLHTGIIGYIISGAECDSAKIKDFVYAHADTINTWAADTSHSHSDLHVIHDILFNPRIDSKWLKYESEVALERYKHIIAIIDKDILSNPSLSCENKQKLLLFPDGRGYNPLHSAVTTMQADVIDAMLALGKKHLAESDLLCMVTQPDKKNFTPLAYAAVLGEAIYNLLRNSTENHSMPEYNAFIDNPLNKLYSAWAQIVIAQTGGGKIENIPFSMRNNLNTLHKMLNQQRNGDGNNEVINGIKPGDIAAELRKSLQNKSFGKWTEANYNAQSHSQNSFQSR